MAGLLCSTFLLDAVWAKLAVGRHGFDFWSLFVFLSILIVTHQISVDRVISSVTGLGNVLWHGLFREEHGPTKGKSSAA